MTIKILSTSPSFGYFAAEPLEYLKANGCEWELLPQGKKISQEELTDRIGGFDAIIVGMEETISEAVLAAASRLKIIAKHGAGVDNIDIPAATRRGSPSSVRRGPTATRWPISPSAFSSPWRGPSQRPIAPSRRANGPAWWGFNSTGRFWGSSGSAGSAGKWRGGPRGST